MLLSRNAQKITQKGISQATAPSIDVILYCCYNTCNPSARESTARCQCNQGERHMADRTGQRLGNYRLTQLLGRGGFAEVYLGEHVRLGTLAAVKVLYTRLASPEEVESFEKEARTIAHLRHPHIVRVFDFDVVDDTPFLVMDYAPNGTLRKLHPRGTKLPLSLILTYVNQGPHPLHPAHVQQDMQRDINPENPVMRQNNELLL